MIGLLPKTLNVEGLEYPIRTDFRVALLIITVYNNPDFSEYDRYEICLDCLYKDYLAIPNREAAYKQAMWFLDGGDSPNQTISKKKVIDWEQDEKIIFPAINKVLGCESRNEKYLHWWTFLGAFGEMGEGLFSTVLHFRQKKADGKKLEKYEEEIYNKNIDLFKIKDKYTEEEQLERDRLNEMLK